MLERLKDILRGLDQASYRVMASGASAFNESRMEEFERALGCALPDDFRSFTMSSLGGLYVEAREDVWRRPRANARPSWKDQFGLKVFGLAAPIPEWLDLREEILALPEEDADLIPFMARVGLAERYCFDLDHRIVRRFSDGRREMLQVTFGELLERELSELQQRLQQARAQAAPRKGRGKKEATP